MSKHLAGAAYYKQGDGSVKWAKQISLLVASRWQNSQTSFNPKTLMIDLRDLEYTENSARQQKVLQKRLTRILNRDL